MRQTGPDETHDMTESYDRDADYWRSVPRRNVTSTAGDPERFRLYRLCDCTACEGTGKERYPDSVIGQMSERRCPACRGEGRTRDLIATCATPEAVGVALVTLGREGEWEECPVGILDTQGETGEKWIVRPWLPSARNVSDAGRTLVQSKTRKGKKA